jgi:hypothetical protein
MFLDEKDLGGEGREANQSLIAFCFGELIPNPLTLRDARMRVFSNMRVWVLGG